MQIDGHHTLTYIAARAAGFTHDEAATVAYAAQYVDDATNAGAIQFEDSAYMYARIASAHRMIDYTNLIEVENHLAWLPFHFLPGNGGLSHSAEPEGGEIGKLVCRPDSPVARDMLRATLADKGTPRALHRLGIAMHVYADTFAHQGFVGALSVANRATDPTSGDPHLDERIKAVTQKELWQKVRDGAKALWQMAVVAVKLMVREHKWPYRYCYDFLHGEPLGHAAADTFPDQPYLVWRYTDWQNVPRERDNPAIFLEAAHMMTRALRAWRADDASMDLQRYPGLGPYDAQMVETLFRTVANPKAEERHDQWLDAIGKGRFSFGPASLRYADKGLGSWKEAALGTTREKDTGLERFPYSPAFLASDWKRFHDALQAHQSDVVHLILPKYGICAA